MSWRKGESNEKGEEAMNFEKREGERSCNNRTGEMNYERRGGQMSLRQGRTDESRTGAEKDELGKREGGDNALLVPPYRPVGW